MVFPDKTTKEIKEISKMSVINSTDAYIKKESIEELKKEPIPLLSLKGKPYYIRRLC